MRYDIKDTICGCDSVIQQVIDLDVTQNQSVSQTNENIQLAAIALALGGGLAKAIQKSCQLNDNTQFGEGITENRVAFNSNGNKPCKGIKITADVFQDATGNLNQQQNVEQSNENTQLITIAVADSSKSTAIADDLDSQTNESAQIGNVTATNTTDFESQTDTFEDKQVKKQVNPASTGSGKDAINKLRLSEHSFAVKVAFSYEGRIMELTANDKGEVKIDETKASNAENTILVAVDLAGDHLEISADQNGNVFVNGEKV